MIDKVPLGLWMQNLTTELTSKYENQFRWFSETLNSILGSSIQLLAWVPSWAMIFTLVVLVYWTSRSFKNALFSGLGLLLVVNLGYWQETLETVSLVVFSTVVSAGFGIPLGIMCAHQKWVYQCVRPILDFMQTIPTFVYLIPTLMFFGLGLAPGVISTVIFVMPACIRLTHLGVSAVPDSLLEVADAFGSNRWQKLIQVEIPYALPSIRAGISQAVMLSLSMVVIAALVGADGLGRPVVQALNTVNIAKGFEAGIVIVIVAVILDRLLVVQPRAETGARMGTAPEARAGVS